MEILDYDDYKTALKEAVKSNRRSRKSLTLRYLAEQLPIQYTYLSKALNDSKTHLNEDHLFRASRILGLLPDETEYLLTLRAQALASSSERKEYLQSKIDQLKRGRHLQAENQVWSSNALKHQMEYLFNPLAVLVKVALPIKEVQRNPKILCQKLGITVHELRQTLAILEANGYLELKSDGITIQAIKKGQVHFGKDHPLMRVHQNLIRTAINDTLLKTSEEDKHSFLATFTADRKTYEKIREEFERFLKKVQALVGDSRHENVFQLSFDLFKWL